MKLPPKEPETNPPMRPSVAKGSEIAAHLSGSAVSGIRRLLLTESKDWDFRFTESYTKDLKAHQELLLRKGS